MRFHRSSRHHWAIALLWLAGGGSLLTAARPAGGLNRFQEEIRHKLATLPYYTVFDNLTFQVQGTEVVLRGEVTWPKLRSDAEAAVREIESVTSIDNRIRVLPVSSNDDRIRRAMYRTLYYHPNFMRYAIRAIPPIHIIVDNGDVKLIGVVATRSDRELAEVRARQVPGVFSVNNELRVEQP